MFVHVPSLLHVRFLFRGFEVLQTLSTALLIALGGWRPVHKCSFFTQPPPSLCWIQIKNKIITSSSSSSTTDGTAPELISVAVMTGATTGCQ